MLLSSINMLLLSINMLLLSINNKGEIMKITSIQRFHNAQEALFQSVSAIPVIAIGPSLAKIMVSLAQIIHGLAMAAFYVIKEAFSGEYNFTNKYVKSVREGVGNLAFGTLNLATIGLFFLSMCLCCSYSTRTKLHNFFLPNS
jgi:hypothetical protein